MTSQPGGLSICPGVSRGASVGLTAKIRPICKSGANQGRRFWLKINLADDSAHDLLWTDF